MAGSWMDAFFGGAKTVISWLGTPQTQRTTLNFTGTSVTVSDGGTQTTVDITETNASHGQLSYTTDGDITHLEHPLATATTPGFAPPGQLIADTAHEVTTTDGTTVVTARVISVPSGVTLWTDITLMAKCTIGAHLGETFLMRLLMVAQNNSGTVIFAPFDVPTSGILASFDASGGALSISSITASVVGQTVVFGVTGVASNTFKWNSAGWIFPWTV